MVGDGLDGGFVGVDEEYVCVWCYGYVVGIGYYGVEVDLEVWW